MSERQRVANQRNATHSTGPRTEAGKRASSRNALRHGLGRDPLADVVLAQEVEKLARRLCAETSGRGLEQARVLAATIIQTQRVEAAKLLLFSRLERAGEDDAGASGMSTEDDADSINEICRELDRLDRYAQRAASRQRKAVRDFLS